MNTSAKCPANPAGYHVYQVQTSWAGLPTVVACEHCRFEWRVVW